mgnify:CR=1 FL=1
MIVRLIYQTKAKLCSLFIIEIDDNKDMKIIKDYHIKFYNKPIEIKIQRVPENIGK